MISREAGKRERSLEKVAKLGDQPIVDPFVPDSFVASQRLPRLND
jgi:hypothetical protein